jgi:radical SAM protein with 4Fe4S-binding SPASM domain
MAEKAEKEVRKFRTGNGAGGMRPFLRPGVVFTGTVSNCDALDLIDLRHVDMSAAALPVLQMCNGKHTVREMVSALQDRSSHGCGDLEALVPQFINTLIEKDILLTEKPLRKMPPQPPGVVFVEITKACNLNCVWCYNNSRAPLPNELTATQWKQCIDRFAAPCTLLFTGGEPLARRDLLEIAGHARNRGLGAQLFTNGTLINAGNLSAIAGTFQYVRITIDGATAATNDRIRGEGSYEKALRGMRMLLDRGVPVCWQCIVSQHNIHELPAIVEKAIEVGASGLRMASVDLLGRGCGTPQLELSAEQEFVFWRFLTWAMEQFKSRIQIDWGADYCLGETWNTVMSIEPGKAPSATPQGRRNPDFYMQFARTSQCGVGVRSFLINSQGSIGLCPLLSPPEVTLGNVLQDDPLDIWYHHSIFSNFREMTLEDYDDCSSCGFRYRCLAGCRGRAFLLGKSLTGCDEKMLKYFVVPASPTPPPASPPPDQS